jgi:hypothetical protein
MFLTMLCLPSPVALATWSVTLLSSEDELIECSFCVSIGLQIPNDSGYALSAAKALPHATQVADRWHLMENAGHAFHDAVRKSMRRGRAAVGAAAINPDLLTAAERIQYGAVYGVRIPTRQSSNGLKRAFP